MKSNIVIKLIAVIVVVIVIVIAVRAGKEKKMAENGSTNSAGANLSAIESGPAKVDNGLSQEKLDLEFLEETQGVDADTPLETMRTLTKEMAMMRKNSEQLSKENKELTQQVEKLLKMQDSITTKVNQNLVKAEKSVEAKQRELERNQAQSQNMLDRVKGKLDELTNGKGNKGSSTAGGYKVNDSGIPSGLGYDDSGNPIDFDEIVWIKPIDMEGSADSKGGIKLPNIFEGVKNAHVPEIAMVGSAAKKKKEAELIKAYTIPQNATLIGSVSMTALLGRVPTGGSIQDPYPFKIIVGEENLSSNGIEIPNVNGIKMTGVASGDWTLSCVSGKIFSMTFTFNDGTIVTYPEPGKKSNEPIAWMSDGNGVPCVTGTRITNAVSYLSSRVGLTTAAAFANANAQAEVTNSVDGLGGSQSVVTGDPTTYAKNTAISEGIKEVTDWLDKRQADSFDAIYVEPGEELAIHLVDEIKIDYDPNGRKVNHYAKTDRRTEHYLD